MIQKREKDALETKERFNTFSVMPFMTLGTDYQIFIEKQKQLNELKAELENYKNFIKSVCFPLRE